MTRVIAGSAKGRKLSVPSKGTRPTSDRVRESLFGRLESWGAVDDARVLDAFAGSGALGIEALSRGAKEAVFVELSAPAMKVLSGNLAEVGLKGKAQLVRKSAQAAVSTTLSDRVFDLVFLDPPYDFDDRDLTALLTSLTGMLSDTATVVVERSSFSAEPTLPAGLELLGKRRHGDTTAWFVGPSNESS